MSLPEACCQPPKFTSSYKPRGNFENIDEFQVYKVGEDTTNLTVFAIYDIFGFQNQTFQFADNLSKTLNAQVIMPDFFLGNPWRMENFPPKGNELLNWIKDAGSWEKSKPIIQKVFSHYKNINNNKVYGFVGFCWGAKISVEVSKLPDTFPSVKAIAILHPSLIEPEDAKLVDLPILVVPTKDDMDFTSFMSYLKDDIKHVSEHYRFEEAHHGFCSAKANFEDPKNCELTQKASSLVVNFFKKHIKQ